MAQSNESNVRGIPSFSSNHSLKTTHSWTQWSDKFQLATTAKNILEIGSFNVLEIPERQFPILEHATGSESDTDRVSREAGENAKKSYYAAEEKRINEEK